jgi:hypothetical protein
VLSGLQGTRRWRLTHRRNALASGVSDLDWPGQVFSALREDRGRRSIDLDRNSSRQLVQKSQ